MVEHRMEMARVVRRLYVGSDWRGADDYNYCGYSDHKAGKRYAAWAEMDRMSSVREAGR